MENKFTKNEELKKEFTNEKTGISYTLTGDYYIPNIIPPEAINYSKLNKYGKARLRFLRENQKAEYTILFIENKLNEHLIDVQTRAENRVNEIINSLKIENNLTEDLKNSDPLYWVGMMNNFKNSAEEIVMNEIIFV